MSLGVFPDPNTSVCDVQKQAQSAQFPGQRGVPWMQVPGPRMGLLRPRQRLFSSNSAFSPVANPLMGESIFCLFALCLQLHGKPSDGWVHFLPLCSLPRPSRLKSEPCMLAKMSVQSLGWVQDIAFTLVSGDRHELHLAWLGLGAGLSVPILVKICQGLGVCIVEDQQKRWSLWLAHCELMRSRVTVSKLHNHCSFQECSCNPPGQC